MKSTFIRINKFHMLIFILQYLITLIRMLDRVIEVNDTKITICQDLSLSHAGTVWDGALCLVAFFNQNRHFARVLFEGKCVLQLGSGTGIVGLSAFSFRPNRLILTDLPQYLQILVRNTHHNNIPAEIMPYEWGQPLPFSAVQTVVGSELAYDADNVNKLMNTLKSIRAQNQFTKIIISYQKYSDPKRNLQHQFDTHFHGMYQIIPSSMMDAQCRDQSIGIIYME